MSIRLILLALFGLLTTTAGDLHLEPDPQNVVADRLAGAWEADEELALRLGTKPRWDRVEVVVDDSILERLPDKYDEPMGQLQLFQSGILTLSANDSVEKYPFVLTNISGNPHVILFRERDGDPLGDAESMNLVVVPAKQKTGDLLFFGGDFNNQPFDAYRRVVDKR